MNMAFDGSRCMREKGRRMMGSMRYLAVMGVVAVAVVLVGRPGQAAVWDNNVSKLCEMELLKEKLELTDEQLDAIKPILAELTRELQRWSWRNNEKYDKVLKDFKQATSEGKTAEACELMNKKKAIEGDRMAVVARFKRKISKELTVAQQGTLEGYRLGEEMVARNKRWRLSDDQIEQIREICYAQGTMLADFTAHANVRAIAKVRASTQQYIVKNVFTDAQRSKLEAPVKTGGPVKTREQLTEEQKKRVELAVSLWAGKRHMEEVARTQKITQQMTNMMVRHNIMLAKKARDYFNRIRAQHQRDTARRRKRHGIDKARH